MAWLPIAETLTAGLQEIAGRHVDDVVDSASEDPERLYELPDGEQDEALTLVEQATLDVESYVIDQSGADGSGIDDETAGAALFATGFFALEGIRSYFRRIHSEVVARQADGDIEAATAKGDEDIASVSENEIGQTYSEYSRTQFSWAGIGRAKWVTNLDGRERACHASVDGQPFDLDKGLNVCGESGVFPGDQYRCRCFMDPLDEDA